MFSKGCFVSCACILKQSHLVRSAHRCLFGSTASTSNVCKRSLSHHFHNVALTTELYSRNTTAVTCSKCFCTEQKSENELHIPKLVKVKKKKSFDYNYTGNVFILPARAMHEFLLTPNDLGMLYKYKRRSPYLYGPHIILYLRSDVEKRAIEVWGSLEKLQQYKKHMTVHENFSESIGELLHSAEATHDNEFISRLSQISKEAQSLQRKPRRMKVFLQSGSSRVVLSAIIVNSINSVIKGIAWIYTGSSSMFSEFVHSLADTLNQIILGLGLYHSIKAPDMSHPYGYQNMRYISSLISGVGIFCFGTGISWYHGFQSILHPEPLGSLVWAVLALAVSFATEGACLIVAVQQIKKSAKDNGLRFLEYIREGHDPNVNVVLLEDLAAVVGVTVAGTCMTLTQYTGALLPDSLGSFIIGGLLGGVATFIIYTNSNFLIGQSISYDMKESITRSLECDRMIRSLHDVKATQMGGEIRFKAEIDFDGREITRAYLYKLDLENLLAEMHKLATQEDVETFMLKHGTEIIDNLGAEIDRIEEVLKKSYPSLRHVDLEAL